MAGPFDFIIRALFLLLNLTRVQRVGHRTLANDKFRARNPKLPILSVLLSPGVSVRLGLELLQSLKENTSKSLFLTLCCRGLDLPVFSSRPSLLTGKCSRRRRSVFLLFPLNFLCSPLCLLLFLPCHQKLTAGVCQLAFVCQCQPRRSEELMCKASEGRALFHMQHCVPT